MTRQDIFDAVITAVGVLVLGLPLVTLVRCATMEATFGDPHGPIICTSCGPGLSCEDGVCSPVEGARVQDAGGS